MPATRGKPKVHADKFVTVVNKYDEEFWQEMHRLAKKNGIPSVPFYISFTMHQIVIAEKAKEARERAKSRTKGRTDA